MSFWTNKDRPTILSDAESLAHAREPGEKGAGRGGLSLMRH